MSFADNLCKQFGPRSDQTKFGSNLFDTLMIFLNVFFLFIFKKLNSEKSIDDQKIHVQIMRFTLLFEHGFELDNTSMGTEFWHAIKAD